MDNEKALELSKEYIKGEWVSIDARWQDDNTYIVRKNGIDYIKLSRVERSNYWNVFYLLPVGVKYVEEE